MMTINQIIVIDTIQSNWPGAEFSVDETYESLTWHTKDITKPSKKQFDDAVTEYTADFFAKQYQRDRKYPNIGDQLDMIYWDKVSGAETWKETIDAVKAKYPKPE